MRRIMREGATLDPAKLEESRAGLSERNKYADRLFEKWSKDKDVGQGMVSLYDGNPNKARGLAICMENQQRHLQRLTETQISNSFQTTPENVIRIVRIGYPNSVRGEIFLEWPMETARDSIYYLYPVYGSTKRGATKGDIMNDSFSYRFPSETEEETVGTGDGSTKTFDGKLNSGDALLNPPLRPFTVKIFVAEEQVAADDGRGNIVGSVGTGTNAVSYATGELSFTLATAPATGEAVMVQYCFDSEDSDQYDDVGSVELQLRDSQFRAKPWPLWISWSKMTELLLGTTLDIDAEEAMVRGAGEELKKALDFFACRLGYRTALKNSLVTFNAQGAVGEAEVDRAMAFTRAIDNASDSIFDAINRGGVTKIYGGPGAVSYVKLHGRFDTSNRQPKVGAHREGNLDGIDVYKVPSAIVPNDELVCVYRNEEVPEDVSIAFGTLVPLYRTQTLEFKNMYSESGIGYFGDAQVLQSKYIVRIKINNLTSES